METCVGEAQISTETQNGYQSCRCRSTSTECGRQPCRSIFGRFCGKWDLFLGVCLLSYVIGRHLIYIALSVLLWNRTGSVIFSPSFPDDCPIFRPFWAVCQEGDGISSSTLRVVNFSRNEEEKVWFGENRRRSYFPRFSSKVWDFWLKKCLVWTCL